jgi:hypothetical protein
MEGSVARLSLALMLAAGVLLSCSGCAIAGGAIVGHVLATHSRKGVGQDVNGSVYQSVAVVKDVLREMRLPVTSEHERLFGVEISTKYLSHRVRIEVRDLSAETSRIDVRVKWPTGDTEDVRRLGIVFEGSFGAFWRSETGLNSLSPLGSFGDSAPFRNRSRFGLYFDHERLSHGQRSDDGRRRLLRRIWRLGRKSAHTLLP